jgi:hypothetical protein
MTGELPFDPLTFSDPNAGRQKIDDMLAFDPFLGSAPITPNAEQRQLDPDYDDKMGMAWQIEELFGREVANRYLLEQGLQALPESDGK